MPPHRAAPSDHRHRLRPHRQLWLAGRRQSQAVRAVGTACATNPIPIVVPCHRVVRSVGTIGSYRGDPVAKRACSTLKVPYDQRTPAVTGTHG
ncbi:MULTISPECIES: methylated-DNA--[protein]-cysteine S-methyltransferase [unclassified Micromonospora]|uniref:methylated-DNA--[protein]-cysteine S-methyltransferase n=1 Tax=Micromonospora sp. NPDC005206 TaxID=3157022 RepID=UPI0033B6F4CC